MTVSEWAAWAQAAAGALTFGAALLAVRAAYQAPRRAAEFAERLRYDSSRAEELNRSKRWILETLMRYRGQILHYDVVAALNMVEITFHDDADVREAYQQFWAAIIAESPPEMRRERFYKVIQAIVKHLGLGHVLRATDIERAYYPTFIGHQIDVQIAETEAKWSCFFNPDGSLKTVPASPLQSPAQPPATQ